MVNLIIDNINIWIFFIGILWGILLDGIIVERGKGYVKVNYFFENSHQFKGDFTGFIFYIIEIGFIAIIISFLSQNFIKNLLVNNFWLAILISFGLAFIKFRKEVYGTYL